MLQNGLMSTEVSVHEAQIHLSRLLDEAMAGEEIVISRSGKPLVRLVPVEEAPVDRPFGTAKGLFVLPADWDNRLPDEVIDEFYK